jgi:hypothetical protein
VVLTAELVESDSDGDLALAFGKARSALGRAEYVAATRELTNAEGTSFGRLQACQKYGFEPACESANRGERIPCQHRERAASNRLRRRAQVSTSMSPYTAAGCCCCCGAVGTRQNGHLLTARDTELTLAQREVTQPPEVSRLSRTQHSARSLVRFPLTGASLGGGLRC